LRSKSHFLYGPRQTGESSMIRHELPDSVVYNLLDSQVFLALSQRLSRLLRKWFVALLAFTSGFEVDFILNGMTAIEGKGKEVVGERDLRGLRALREEGLLRNYLVVSCERPPG
jgi:hypothetical protein